MLSNFPLIEGLKKLTRTKKELLEEDEPQFSFYDIFKNENAPKPWEIRTKETDRKRVLRAQQNGTDTTISRDLSDVQLLKLHSSFFPDYDTTLLYHSDFDMYEVKEDGQTKYLFMYINGKYTSIESIF